MRTPVGLTLCLLLGMTGATGCGPAVPPEDLGTVLSELPEIPGAEESFEMPKLGPPTDEGPQRGHI